MSENIYFDILTAKISKVQTCTKCTKCGSKNVKVTEFATRSADEATTMFIRCKDCSNVEVTYE
jgi:DNA-directed RNA polymerase subunit M/transcription elongation factor TFIIS